MSCRAGPADDRHVGCVRVCVLGWRRGGWKVKWTLKGKPRAFGWVLGQWEGSLPFPFNQSLKSQLLSPQDWRPYIIFRVSVTLHTVCNLLCKCVFFSGEKVHNLHQILKGLHDPWKSEKFLGRKQLGRVPLKLSLIPMGLELWQARVEGPTQQAQPLSKTS